MDGKDIRKIFGASLKEIRTYNGLTQEKLAELIGKQLNAVQRMESGWNFVTSDTYAELCNVLKVPPAVFMTPRPDFILKEHVDYLKDINQLLLTFPPSKLKQAYKLLSVLNE